VQTSDIENIFKIFKQHNPNPRTELEYVNNYTLLVAVVLSAQSTDVGVNKATKALFAKYDTPEKMVTLGIDGLKKYIKTIGLFNTKAANVIKLSEDLIRDHNSIVPDNLDSLVKLPGVGRKTANVVLNAAFGKATMPVDTHVGRVANRIDLSDGKTPEKIEKDLLDLIPQKYLYDAHHWLVLHGRYICKARKPECEKCPVSEYCRYFKINSLS
jgi:endonuclease-3